LISNRIVLTLHTEFKDRAMDIIKSLEQDLIPENSLPDFKAGDNVSVHYKIIEGVKERIQIFRGDVIQRKGSGSTQTFTVRKISSGVGVERIFPLYSPSIAEIEIHKKGRVRRARIFYLRKRRGKAARIKELRRK